MVELTGRIVDVLAMSASRKGFLRGLGKVALVGTTIAASGGAAIVTSGIGTALAVPGCCPGPSVCSGYTCPPGTTTYTGSACCTAFDCHTHLTQCYACLDGAGKTICAYAVPTPQVCPCRRSAAGT